MTTFEEVIETKVEEPRGQLTRLIQYTSGEAKDLVKSCIYLDPPVGYLKAKELLQKRFGDPHSIINLKELRQWKPIKHGDSAALRNLYTFLVKSNHIVNDYFHFSDNVCTVISKHLA